VTDPERTPDPLATAARLRRGSGVVFRPFGHPEALSRGPALRRLAARRGLLLWVGADPALAAALRAQGLHLPERMSRRAGDIGRWKRRFRVTAAAHSVPAAIAARRAGVEALLVSPVFASNSPSATRPLGVLGLRRIARAGRLPCYALGGVNARTARALLNSGAVGLAAVEGLANGG
jgi:thiamine-phosphate pyrophosphorylase